MRTVLTVVFVWSMFIPALSAAPASGEAKQSVNPSGRA